MRRAFFCSRFTSGIVPGNAFFRFSGDRNHFDGWGGIYFIVGFLFWVGSEGDYGYLCPEPLNGRHSANIQWIWAKHGLILIYFDNTEKS